MSAWMDFVHPDYHSSAQSTHISPSYPEMNQVESSIGPSRVMTRGQRRARDSVLSRNRNAPTSRPGTPAMAMPSTNLMGSYPLTPDSSSHSPYYLPSHSRSHSSSYEFVRDPSPALSTNTSLSSNSAPNSQSLHVSPALTSPFPRPSFSPTSPVAHTFSPGVQDPLLDESINTRPKQRKQRLYNLDRQLICKYHLEHPTARQEDIARRYGVERSTISKILKYKAKWLNVSPDETLRVAKHRPSKFPVLERLMVEWVEDPVTRTKPLTDTRLREKAREIARSMQITEDKFKASSGWVDNFKSRHGIRNGDWTGDGKRTKIARAVGYGPAMTPLALQLEAEEEAKREAKASLSYQRVVSSHHQPWSTALLTPEYSPIDQSQSQNEHPRLHQEQLPNRLHPEDECYSSHTQLSPPENGDLLPRPETSSSELYPSDPSQLYPPPLHTSTTESSISPGVQLQTSNVLPLHNTPPSEIQAPPPPETEIQHLPPPTAKEAEAALDRVLQFFSSTAITMGIPLRPELTNALQEVKTILFANVDNAFPYNPLLGNGR